MEKTASRDNGQLLPRYHNLTEDLHTIFLAALTCILIMILVGELLPRSNFVIRAATPSFSDDFVGSQLASTWQWVNPSTSSSNSVINGQLTINVASGNDQWINVDKAPRILRSQRTAPWSIETKISSSNAAVSGQNLAGLVIFKDPQNWFVWGQLGNKTLEGSGVVANNFSQVVATVDNKFNYLRIRRIGNSYYFDASLNGSNWTNANVWQDTQGALNTAGYGFLAKDWSTGSGISYSVSFDYFKEYSEDMMPSVLIGTSDTVQVAKEVGSGAVNNTTAVDVCGTDLGSMFEWNGKTYFAFGDTSKCPLSNTNLDRSNVLAVSGDVSPSDGITFDSWVTSGGRAKELFAEDSGTVTAIPTYGVGIGPTAYLYYMQVTNWGQSGTWSCNYSSIASSNDGQNWVKQSSRIQWGSGNFNQVAIYKQDPYLYIWGIPCGRNGSVRLMRVNQSSIIDKTQYQYFSGFDTSGNPTWVNNNELAAVTVAGGPVGEISVIYNPWLARYVMTYLENYSGKIVVRESANPWGPWSAPVTITTAASFPGLYGAFMKAGYWENNGESLYFMISKFFPDYATYLLKTTLKKSIIVPTPTPTPTPQPLITKATNLTVASQQCVSDGVKVAFGWTRAGEGPGQTIDGQWLDLSVSNNNFAQGTFSGTSDPPFVQDNSYTTGQTGGKIGSLMAGKIYYWRINTHYLNGSWSPSATSSFTTVSCNPTAATSLTVNSQQCVPNGVKVAFSWNLANGAGKPIEDQWFDLSTVDGSFAAGTFVGAHLVTNQTNYIAQDGNPIGPLSANKGHWFRINSKIGGQWYPSSAKAFATRLC